MGRLFHGDVEHGLENQPFQLQLIPEQRGWEWRRVPSVPGALEAAVQGALRTRACHQYISSCFGACKVILEKLFLH